MMTAYQNCRNIKSDSSTELFLQPVDRCSSKDDPIERVDEYGYRVSCCSTRKRLFTVKVSNRGKSWFTVNCFDKFKIE